MKLSMWVIADWLSDYSPECDIKSGEAVIENIRLFNDTESEILFSRNTLYVGYKKDFFQSGSDGIICISNNDLIWFNHLHLYDIVNHLLIALEVHNLWMEDLHNALTKNCELQELLTASCSILPFPLAVLSTSQYVLAITDRFPPGTVDEVWDTLLNQGYSDTQLLIAFNRSNLRKSKVTSEPYLVPEGIFPSQCYSLPLYHEKQYMAELVMIDPKHQVTKGQLHLLQSLGGIIIQWFQLYSHKNELMLPEKLVDHLLNGSSAQTDEFKLYLKLQSWKETDAMTLLCLQCVSDTYNINQHFRRIISFSFPEVFCALYQSQILILLNHRLTKPDTFFENIKPYLVRNQYYGAVGFDFTELSSLSEQLLQARIALQMGEKKNGSLHRCSDFLFPYAMLQLRNTLAVPFCHPALGQLKTHDIAKNTDLYSTLYMFLQLERNQVRTAESLHIHRNTFTNRLLRIQELTGLDLEDAQLRCYLLLSFYAEKFSADWQANGTMNGKDEYH